MDNFLDFIYQNRMLVLLLSILLSVFAQSLVNGAYNKYSKVDAPRQITGKEVAMRIMQANNINDVTIEVISQTLGDHYDPTKKVVRLSQDVANNASVASQAIAAHEVGHVIQHHQASVLLKIRTLFLPLATIGSKGSFAVIFAGIIFQMSGLVLIGIVLLGFVLLFQIATLPVEFDASRRAMIQLNDLGIVTNDTQQGVKKVLNAAAFTYVVAVITTLLTMLRLLSIARRN